MLCQLRRFALLILFALILFPAQAGAENRGLLWAVEGQQCTVWLMGSLHFARQDTYPLSRATQAAFTRATALVVEVDVASVTQEEMESMGALAIYPQGETLADHLPAALLVEFREAGMDLAPYNAMRPWYAAMIATSAKLMELGLDPQYGLDLYFITRAHQQGLPVLELESVSEQFTLMKKVSERDEVQFMRLLLDDIDDMKRQLEELFAFWVNGDAQGMGQELFDDKMMSPEVLPMLDAIYYQRNKTMAEKISGHLNGDKDVFVVVGAGHLVGEQSIVELLRQRGFDPVQE